MPAPATPRVSHAFPDRPRRAPDEQPGRWMVWRRHRFLSKQPFTALPCIHTFWGERMGGTGDGWVTVSGLVAMIVGYGVCVNARQAFADVI